MTILDKTLLLFAQGLGCGLSPIAPGTVATIAISVVVFFTQPSSMVLILLTIIVSVVGIYICHVAEQVLKTKDASSIVWDEWAGMLLVLCFVPLDTTHVVFATVLFRLFDIFKPWPIAQCEHYFHGGFGIMIDDIMAALYTLGGFIIFKELVIWLNV